jgi:hypothetical protein
LLAFAYNKATKSEKVKQQYNDAHHYQLRRNACYAKMRSNELADRMGITTANLSILKPEKQRRFGSRL